MPIRLKPARARRRSSPASSAVTPKVKSAKRELAADKTYFTVSTLSEKIGADEHEIKAAIRFGVLGTVKFPVRGAKRLRIEEDAARVFARRYYAKLI